MPQHEPPGTRRGSGGSRWGAQILRRPAQVVFAGVAQPVEVVRAVKRLPVANERTRILSLDEQRRLLRACAPKLQAIVALALITGARIGELCTLRREQCDGGYLTFLETKNGKARRIPVSPAMAEILPEQSKVSAWVFTNPRTGNPYTTLAASFKRALTRAGIVTGDVTLHTLRHTALSRMIEAGYTVNAEDVVTGGPHGIRTHDLRVANAALSQLS